MRSIFLLLFVLTSSLCFSQSDTAMYSSHYLDETSKIYTRVFEGRAHSHLDSIQFLFHDNGIAEEFTFKGDKGMKVFEGTWKEKDGFLIVCNRYSSVEGLPLEMAIEDTCGVYLSPLIDMNKKQLIDYFIEFRNKEYLYGFEQAIVLDSLPQGDSFRICENTGSICSDWKAIPMFKCFNLKAQIGFDASYYYWVVEKYKFYRKNCDEIGLVDVIYYR